MKGIRLLKLSQLLSPKPTKRDIAPFGGTRLEMPLKTGRNGNDGAAEPKPPSGSNEQAFVVIIYYQVASAVSIGAALAAIWGPVVGQCKQERRERVEERFLEHRGFFLAAPRLYIACICAGSCYFLALMGAQTSTLSRRGGGGSLHREFSVSVGGAPVAPNQKAPDDETKNPVACPHGRGHGARVSTRARAVLRRA